MSEFQHTYTDYVNHILNKSPSKTAYSFSKAERFPTVRAQAQEQPLQPQPCMHANGYSYCCGIKAKQPAQQDYNSDINRSNTWHRSDFGTKKEVERLLRQIERKHRLKSRQQSPKKLYPHHPNYYRNSRESHNRHQSPLKSYCNNRKSPSPSPSKKKKKPSPLKNLIQELREVGHPSQNMTITGYYPVGTQISPTGRYASSRIPNVVSTRFSPSHSKRSFFPQVKDEEMGPGHYTYFSEFGS